MPTKRTRTARASGVRITPEIVALYKRGLELNDFNIQCIESDEMCTHAECDECREISTELHMKLRLAPWLPSPLDENDGCRGWEIVAPIKQAIEQAVEAEG